mgnify:CR=1 FL=1
MTTKGARPLFQVVAEPAALAVSALRTERARSVLAVAGIVIGIVTVVLVASVLANVRNQIAQLFRDLGTENVFAFHLTGDPYSQPSAAEVEREPLDLRFVPALKRLGTTIADVGAQVAAGKLHDKLLSQLGAAASALQEGGVATGKARKRAYRRVVKALTGVRARLDTKPAKALDATLRSALAGRLDLRHGVTGVGALERDPLDRAFERRQARLIGAAGRRRHRQPAAVAGAAAAATRTARRGSVRSAARSGSVSAVTTTSGADSAKTARSASAPSKSPSRARLQARL